MEEARKLSCDMCVLIRGMGEEQLMLPLQHLSMALCNVTAVTSTQIVILIALLICLPLQMSIWSHLGDRSYFRHHVWAQEHTASVETTLSKSVL